ncbi:STAS domain-containing protein [Streptomyces sp. LP05-1]|uniref:Anti-sigma factor antagonist n=1 Tax=Streptomyces pyxinae TaxID=2970734 RepID=A0ABT2CBG9_9ACTN|nr:STAS domain-containing protein [Streptomyces sp. LP05-1]MCS0634716.1 STAS domain-containing protein [Streptomyces sp. LP05-1]
MWEDAAVRITGGMEGDAYVLTVAGELDHEDEAEFRDALTVAVQGGSGRLVVDFSGLEFADSTALHGLLSAQRLLAPQRRELVVTGPLRAHVARLFEISGTADQFSLVDSTEATRDR